MAVEIHCPDCGGIIGGDGADGRRACMCVVPTPSKSDTVRLDIPVRDVNDAKRKVCITCGKDVTGHRRVKDSRGYQCLPCARAEMEAEKAGTVRCAECGRRVRPQGLVDYDHIKICKRCFNDHKELKKRAVKRVATRHYEIHEKKTLIWLSVVAAILLCLVLYGWLRS